MKTCALFAGFFFFSKDVRALIWLVKNRDFKGILFKSILEVILLA